MRWSWCLVVLLLMPPSASAQTSVDDGLQAMQRGDYAAAVQILRPLAERSPANPVAQFLMGTLYLSGQGVPPDSVRACGMWLASAVPANPLATQALALARLAHHDVPPLQQACLAASVRPPGGPAAQDGEPGGGARVPGAHSNVSQPESRSTDAGIGALIRNDFVRAAGILQPIAESHERDPLASFFMAAIYQNGQGVDADLTRACALYVRASHARTPISRMAEDLVRSLRESMSVDRFQECVQLANTGFNHGFQPAQFSLDAGRWISIDINGFELTNDGTRRKKALSFGPEGSSYFPVRHMEINAAPDRGGRRDFVQLFAWMPRGKDNWVLHWQLFEVQQDDLVLITRVELRTATGRLSDLDMSLDVDTMARVQLDADGYAEWEVSTGPKAGRGSIPTDAERRASAERAREEAAVRSRVDWNKASDMNRPPALGYSGAQACGSVSLFGWSADLTEAISLTVSARSADLASVRRLDLSTPTDNLDLKVVVYERPQRSWEFCTDVYFTQIREVWRPVAGTATVQVVQNAHRSLPPTHTAIVTIEDAEFISASGQRVKQSQPVRLTAAFTPWPR